MKIILGSDHAGFEAKEEIKKILENNSIEFVDMGVDSQNSVDYPDIAKKVSDVVSRDWEDSGDNVGNGNSGNNGDNGYNGLPNTLAILICGSGTGMQIAANKHPGIRAVFAYDTYGTEMARKDNDANVLTLRAREFDWSKYEEIIMKFINTPFSNEKRHINRVKKLK